MILGKMTQGKQRALLEKTCATSGYTTRLTPSMKHTYNRINVDGTSNIFRNNLLSLLHRQTLRQTRCGPLSLISTPTALGFRQPRCQNRPVQPSSAFSRCATLPMRHAYRQGLQYTNDLIPWQKRQPPTTFTAMRLVYTSRIAENPTTAPMWQTTPKKENLWL